MKSTPLDLHTTASSDLASREQSEVDYSQPQRWLALPSAKDALRDVDVFYLYPTEYITGSDGPLMSAIDDPSMLAGAQKALEEQASVFSTVGNVFAPYYRQAAVAHILKLSSLNDIYRVIGTVPQADATAAFDYYIRHYNNGRPFILASHSQGSTVAALLLQNYMKRHPEVYRRMIAAYAIGWSYTKDFFAKNPHLRFATGPDDTGVVVSYNTQGPSFSGRNPVVFPGALAINPISWTTGSAAAPAAHNLGSLHLDANGSALIPVRSNAMRYADATVTAIDPETSEPHPASATSVVVCTAVDPASLCTNSVFKLGCYHNYDYAFYYTNLRQNAQNRTRNFFRQL